MDQEMTEYLITCDQVQKDHRDLIEIVDRITERTVEKNSYRDLMLNDIFDTMFQLPAGLLYHILKAIRLKLKGD